MIELPPPVELGLPAKFTSWRPQQLQAIDQQISATTPVVAHNMPVGSGKSATAITEILLSGERGIILTATKALQKQYSDDFGPMGLADIRGRSSYECTGFPSTTCEDGRHLKCPFRTTVRCAHTAAVQAASAAPMVVTNYTCYVTNHMEHPRPWGEFGLLIADEAHDAPFELADCLSIHFTENELDLMLHARLPVDTPDDWLHFAGQHVDRLQKSVEAEERRLDPRNLPHVRRVVSTKRLLTRLKRVQAFCGRGEWVVEVRPDGHTLEVLWPAPYAAEMLFRGISKSVLMSATLTRKTCALLGISDDDLDYREYASPFSPLDNLVYVLKNAPRMDRRTYGEENLREWVGLIDEIIDARLDRKGIIHTVSYARAREVCALSRHSAILIPHDSHNTLDRVAMYRRAKAPAVLVSPSVSTGYDFAGDSCHYQIISKLPFPDSRNLITKLRSAEDPMYAPYLTAQRLIQSTGRGKRLDSDKCENFIIDSHFTWFYNKYRHLFPNATRALIRFVEKVPEPFRLGGEIA